MVDTPRAQWEALVELRAAAEASGDFGSFDRAVDQAFGACESGEQLWRLASSTALAQDTYADGEHDPALIGRLIDKAERWIAARKPQDAAAAIALASRVCVFEPGRLAQIEDEAVGLKEPLAAALDSEMPWLRKQLAAEDESVRAACLHALACCRNAGAQEAELIAECLQAEQADDAIASGCLALGALVRRLSGTNPALAPKARAVLAAFRRQRVPLVGACSASACALMGSAIDPVGADAIVEAIDARCPLPIGWGWRRPEGSDTAADLGARVLSWAEVESQVKGRCIAALARFASDTFPYDIVEDALFRLAFEDIAKLPPLGYSLEELSHDQRVALRVFARGEGVSNRYLTPLGLHLRSDVELLLEGRGGLFEPLVVATEAGERRWHLVRAWREHLSGHLDRQLLVDAAIAGLEPRELVEAICSNAELVLLRLPHTTPEHEALIVDLRVALFRALAASGFDLLEALSEMVAGGRLWSNQGIALGLLCAYEARGTSPTPTEESVIAKGLRHIPPGTEAEALLARLAPDQRKRIATRLGIERTQATP